MLGMDHVNNTGKMEDFAVILARLEDQIRSENRKHNRVTVCELLGKFNNDWAVYRNFVEIKDFYQYLEHAVNMPESTARKYVRFNQIMVDHIGLLRGFDFKSITSIYMLDNLKEALENHSERKVIEALQSMSVREFRRFAKRLPLYIAESSPISSGNDSGRNTFHEYIDFSRYRDLLLDSFESGRKVLTIGVRSLQEWDKILNALKEHGLEYLTFEEGTQYASIVLRQG